MKLQRYKVPERWKGRIDSEEDQLAFRWHQVVRYIDLYKEISSGNDTGKKNVCLLGFCCDEGVKRNMGRPGAAKGPASIRKELANWPANFQQYVQLYDAGDITCEDGNMEAAQAELSLVVDALLGAGFFPILLGGGHEIALGHYNGILSQLKKEGTVQSPAIINFDAHLDIRPIVDKGSSGTMFNQIYQLCQKEQKEYNYLCIGPQTYANTQSLFAQARAMGARYILAKDLVAHNLPNIVTKVLTYIQSKNHVYLTLCTDVLSAAHAPGVSAVQPFGLDPELVLELIKAIVRTGKVCSMDIAEVSPRFDSDNRTAKLVAVYIYAVINVLIEEMD